MTKPTDYWATPQEIFHGIELMLNVKFTLDVCANENNSKCQRFITEEENGLITAWDTNGWNWCNPPYSQIHHWVNKASDEFKYNGTSSVLLLRSDTGTKWFHNAIHSGANPIFLTPRIMFVAPDGIPASSNTTPSVLLIWGENHYHGIVGNWKNYCD